jgi:hypothetical protein
MIDDLAIRSRIVVLYGEPIVSFAESRGVKVYVMKSRERFIDVSASMRQDNSDVDSWEHPPLYAHLVSLHPVYLTRNVPRVLPGHFPGYLVGELPGHFGPIYERFERLRRSVARRAASALVSPARTRAALRADPRLIACPSPLERYIERRTLKQGGPGVSSTRAGIHAETTHRT